ncbi:MAG: peptide chain release factor N(5)-glutamine methyltransferase [Candidatus Binataceae bacterium]
MRSRIRVDPAIQAATAALDAAGFTSARLDAEVLAAAAVGISRAQLLTFADPFPPDAHRCFETFLTRRLAHEPVAYITGRKEFFSLELEVNPAVLIPRPETETLVAAALERLNRLTGRSPLRVLELGTGSGAIAIAIAVNDPRVEVVATDLSHDALAVASRNAIRHRVNQRIRFEQADLWPSAVAAFDLVVANPPYIPRAQIAALAPEIAEHEPLIALDGGLDGLDFYRRIANGMGPYLVSGGQLLVEIGADQAADVIAIFKRRGGTELSAITDLAEHPRVIIAAFHGA